MENYQGDLNDIILASSNKGAKAYSAGMAPETTVAGWHQPFPSHDHPYFTPLVDDRSENFGDPFCNMRDPLLDAIQAPNSSNFNAANSSNIVYSGVEDTAGSFSNSSTTFTRPVVEEDHSMRPGDMYSQVLAISPEDKLTAPSCGSTTMAASCGAIKNNFHGVDPSSQYISNNCLVESTGMMQISSSRNISVKRRKNQAKKVVCIPAPTAANSRATGEVVPSDLWAWRKYGQKPIKGSPHPRGYYRCSSSKGCPARKQVERSRTDPNMLVITYTCEHNHPWPTQRNALAGSTRSHPSKHTSKTQQPSHEFPSNVNNNTSSSSNIKEESDDQDNERRCSSGNGQREEEDLPPFNAEYSNDQSSEDFFAELGELDADPLSDILLNPADQHYVESKDLDPFNNILEWLSNEESKKVYTPQDPKIM